MTYNVFGGRLNLALSIYSVNQKSSPPPKTFCDIFTYGEPV